MLHWSNLILSASPHCSCVHAIYGLSYLHNLREQFVCTYRDTGTDKLKNAATMMYWKKTCLNRWLLGTIDQLPITRFPLLYIIVHGYHFCSFAIIMSHVLGMYLYIQNACPAGELSGSSHIRCNNYFRCERIWLWSLFTFTSFRAPLSATWWKKLNARVGNR